MFVAEERQHLRRLVGLGVLAHQTAIAGQCNTADEERLEVTKSIMQQRAGSNAKETKAIHELNERQANSDDTVIEKIAIIKARIASNAMVKWKRTWSDKPQHQERDQQEKAANISEV